MADRYTEVTQRGYGARVTGAVTGMLIGLAMFIGSFPLIIMNEENAVKTFRGLEEGLMATISVDATQIVPENEGRLVHFFGHTETKGPLADEAFGLQVPNALRLRRKVEFYQWEESSKSNTVKELGGSERTETVYEYRKVWREGRIDSSEFKKPDGHHNPQPLFSSIKFNTDSASIGAVAMPSGLIAQLSDFEPLPMPDSMPDLPEGFSVRGEYIQNGTPTTPQVGDERVSFQVVTETEVTVLAEQSDTTLKPYRTSQGTDIFAAYSGRLSKEQAFDREQTKASIQTWIFRALAFGMMFFGLTLLFRPLAVLADVIPLIGSIVGGGVMVVSFVIAAPLWFLTTAFAWLAYRPFLSVGLAVGGVLLAILVRKIFPRKTKPIASPQTVEAS